MTFLSDNSSRGRIEIPSKHLSGEPLEYLNQEVSIGVWLIEFLFAEGIKPVTTSTESKHVNLSTLPTLERLESISDVILNSGLLYWNNYNKNPNNFYNKIKVWFLKENH